MSAYADVFCVGHIRERPSDFFGCTFVGGCTFDDKTMRIFHISFGLKLILIDSVIVSLNIFLFVLRQTFIIIFIILCTKYHKCFPISILSGSPELRQLRLSCATVVST